MVSMPVLRSCGPTRLLRTAGADEPSLAKSSPMTTPSNAPNAAEGGTYTPNRCSLELPRLCPNPVRTPQLSRPDRAPISAPAPIARPQRPQPAGVLVISPGMTTSRPISRGAIEATMLHCTTAPNSLLSQAGVSHRGVARAFCTQLVTVPWGMRSSSGRPTQGLPRTTTPAQTTATRRRANVTTPPGSSGQSSGSSGRLLYAAGGPVRPDSRGSFRRRRGGRPARRVGGPGADCCRTRLNLRRNKCGGRPVRHPAGFRPGVAGSRLVLGSKKPFRWGSCR